ncbi:hypothetical protein CASFOL_025527 [Castilleja foliolosa]|uniref:Protein phosphatase n=1 Tax=Castilleja foliolosa TaxID=1961234 RepID=A0ABD3CRC8_9LAMI
MQFDRIGNHMAAAVEYSGHAFSAVRGCSGHLHFDSMIRNSKKINSPLKMVAASKYLPKVSPSHPRGDDAHFIAADEQFIGVSDGVGGWRKHGIDGGEYARRFMINSLIALIHKIPNNNNNGWHAKSPKRVLEEAYVKTTTQGSSTACIISFSGEDNMLRAANVGDSGFMVIRNGAVLYRSPIQQRSSNNCPYQLGTTKDDPSVAEEIELRVEKGDLVILGTDGLFDNMFEREMLDILERGAMLGDDLVKQCSDVAKIAHSNSLDRLRDTPYSIASRRAGKRHKGGKIDDITVIIARIE